MNTTVLTGGHSITGAGPIRGDLAKIIADEIIDSITKEFNINCSALGSTGKKGKDQKSGDIDIAVEMPWEERDKLISFVNKNFDRCIFGNIVDYLNVFNIGYRYKEDNEEKIVQVDFMFVDDLEWAKFVYYSPNFINHESEFKGSWRSTLLRGICACTPVEKINNIYKTEYFEDGNIKSYWKFIFSQADGLLLDHKTYEGTKKVLKNPVSIKEDRKYISKDIDEIIYLCLGLHASRDDCNSYESLLKFLVSERYEYRSIDQLYKIKDWLFSNSDLLREASEEVKNKARELFDKSINILNN